MREIARMARVFDRPIDRGGWPRCNTRTTAGFSNGRRVEFHLGVTQVKERVFEHPPQPADDVVRIPDAPGLGLEPDHDGIRASRVPA